MAGQRGIVAGDADLVSLRLLAAVARAGSISAGATQLGISQQAASVRMRRLEESLGLSLLTRSPHGSTLTTEGATAAVWASDVVDAAERFAAGVTALRAESAAPLRVAASLTVAEYLLPRWLMALRETDAASRVAITAGNSERVVELLRTGEAGLGFIESPLTPAELSGLASATVARDELVVVVTPEHPWAGRGVIGAAELARTPLVAREPGSGTRLVAERMLAEAGHPPATPLAEFPTTAAIRTAVAAGAGPAVLSILAVRDDLAAGRLARVRVRGIRFTRELRAVYRPGVEQLRAASALLDAVARSAAV